MNRNHLIGFSVVLLVLLLAIIFLWQILEIHPSYRVHQPSLEARNNSYLALDRWLEQNGFSVRINNYGSLSSISSARENKIFLQSSLVFWTLDLNEYLKNRVYEGAYLVISIDPRQEIVLQSLLDDFGINTEEIISGNFIKAQIGEGYIIVTGESDFLMSNNIENNHNAALAWNIFFAPFLENVNYSNNKSENGWFFVRRITQLPEQGLIGNLFSEGNFTILLLSAAVLLIIGFWAIIPMFGFVKKEKIKPGRPLKDRFLSEGLFYKKHRGLNFYRDLYLREIKRKALNINNEELERISLYDTNNKKEYMKMILNIKSILE